VVSRSQKLEFTEVVDARVAAYLSSLSNSELLAAIKPDLEEELALEAIEHGQKHADETREHTIKKRLGQVRRYCNLTKTTGSVRVAYDFARLKGTNLRRSSGRVFPTTPGIQPLPSTVRGALCRNMGLYDADMINAHPTLLLHLCKTHGLDVPALEHYVKDRADFLRKTGRSKEQMLVIINKDSPTHSNSQLVRQFDCDVKKAQDFVWSCPEFRYVRYTDREHVRGSYLSQCLSDLEHQMLMRVVSAYRQSVNSLHFDGVMLSRKVPIDELNAITADHGVTWSYKDHSTVVKVSSDFLN
jgi:hypothetical protein